jgi:hypothetical protein
MKRELKSFVAVLAVVGVAGVARGVIGTTLSINDGVDPVIIIGDNGPGDLNPAVGVLTLSTNVGVWSLTVSTGATKPALGNSTNPVMDLVIQASSTGAGSLTYTFSDSGFTHAPATLNSTVSGHVISGASTTIKYNVFGDPSNLVGTLTTQLTTTGTVPLPILTSNSGSLAFTTPFSLSQVVLLTASGPSAVSVDASLNVSSVPEPSSVALTFLGLVFLVAGLAHRRRSLHGVN